jgi:hypothetical protein
VKLPVRHLIVSPNRELFWHWLEKYPDTDPAMTVYVWGYEQIAGNYMPIVVLNGGSLDPNIMALVNHPSRRGIVTHVEV